MDCEILNSVEVTTIIIISSAVSAAVSMILNTLLNHYRDQAKSMDDLEGDSDVVRK